MADPRSQAPALLVIAAFSRHDSVLSWARQRLEADCGPIGIVSPPFQFNQTSYYAKTMGTELRKELLVFRELIAPERLPDVKLHTNEIERELVGQYPESRPLNLDPGLLVLGKFLLATTKDQGHRIYLREGIFAEVTLRYQAGAWEPWPWTYADYREPVVREFLLTARDYYRERLEEHNGGGLR